MKFQNQGEVRPGLAYTLVFTGLWQPDLGLHNLSNQGWTNLHMANSRYFTLILWNFEGDQPGFQAVCFDIENQAIEVSKRFDGFIDQLNTAPLGGSKLTFNVIVEPKPYSAAEEDGT